MSVYDYRTEPFAGAWDDPLADPPDFGQPDDTTDACEHGVDLMTGDCGSCEGPLPGHIRDAGGDDSEARFVPDEPCGRWVNAFGQQLRPGAPHFPGDRWVTEPVKHCRGCTAMLGAGDPDVCERCDSHESEAIAIPIPTPVFAPGRLAPGGCRICAMGPVLRVGGDGITIALCVPHAEVVWQQLTGAIEAGVTVQPQPPEQTQPATRTHWCHECESDVAADHDHEGHPGRKGPVVEPLGNATESPEAAAQRCSCWESPRHHVCQCSCHDEAVGQ